MDNKDNIWKICCIISILVIVALVIYILILKFNNTSNSEMEVSIMLDNESKDEKIEAKTLEVKLLDKAGKEI